MKIFLFFISGFSLGFGIACFISEYIEYKRKNL